MNIGIDFGDVIADQNSLMRYIIRNIFGVEDIPDEELTREVLIGEVLSDEQYTAMKQLVYLNPVFGIEKLKEVDGAVDFINRLQDAHKLYVVSKRYNESIEIARRWVVLRQFKKELPFYGTRFDYGETKCGDVTN